MQRDRSYQSLRWADPGRIAWAFARIEALDLKVIESGKTRCCRLDDLLVMTEKFIDVRTTRSAWIDV